MSKDVMDLVLERLGQLDFKLDTLMAKGCSKADSHERIDRGQSELFSRVRSLEESRAEGKGRLAVAVAIASTGITLFVTWIGKQF